MVKTRPFSRTRGNSKAHKRVGFVVHRQGHPVLCLGEAEPPKPTEGRALGPGRSGARNVIFDGVSPSVLWFPWPAIMGHYTVVQLERLHNYDGGWSCRYSCAWFWSPDI